MTATHSTTHGDGEPSHEITGARTFAGRMRRFRVGAEDGEVFECDADFDGLTLTIEVSDMQDGENLIRILAGWLPVPDTPTVAQVARRICAEQCAHHGEPPCWTLGGAWPPSGCDDPGCMALARAALWTRSDEDVWK